MFTKLKKKIAEEAAMAPRPGGATRIPRSVSKESITSAGADSGDDFASDGSSSRDDLPSQISRRKDQIRRLEAKLSDYAEQIRNLQKMKEKLENALEKHQDSTVRKFQEQNEAHQAHRAKMVEEHALALEKKDQEWLGKIAHLKEENIQLSNHIDIMKEKSFSFFPKREDPDEVEAFHNQEMSKIKYMLLKKEEFLSQVQEELKSLRTEVVVSKSDCQDAQELSARLKEALRKVQEENDNLSQQRIELTSAQEGAEKKITELEKRQQELQDFIQNLSLDLQKAQSVACTSEKRLTVVQEEHEALHLHYEQFKSKVSTLNRKLQEAQDFLQQKEAEISCFKEESFLKVTKLNRKLQEAQNLLQQKEAESSCFKKESSLKVADLKARIEKNTQEISLKNEELMRKDEETTNLKRDYDVLVLQMQQFHSDLELYKTIVDNSEECSERHASSVGDQLQEQLAVLLTAASQVSSWQEAVSAVNKPLNGTNSQESNGEVEVGDIPQLQRENQELKQQIAEKNKTIKQLQQRMVELKKTLQKELKLKPEAEVNDVREKANSDPLATSLTSRSDLTDSREINFEYLKHVVLKFMSAREAEAFHLIKAVSVLLNFSVEEENLLKETLEYKMSWFGSKPIPKGTVRPSISKPRTTWP